MQLERPLGVFGKSFKVELSTGLTLGPDTVMRAALRKSVLTFLRDSGSELPLRQLVYALRGKHRITRTTRDTINRAMGPAFTLVEAVLGDHRAYEEMTRLSDWEAVALTWGALSTTHPMDIVVATFVELDQVAKKGGQAVLSGNRAEAERLLCAAFGDDVQPEWLRLCPHLSLQGAILIETSLHVVARLEASLALSAQRPDARAVTWVALELLAPKHRPLGNWLQQLCAAAGCQNYPQLADLTLRKGICHRNGKRPITHGALKDWSRMKSGNLMSIEAWRELVKVLSLQAQQEGMIGRFALTCFLAFLCDLLRSTVHGDPPSWEEAQRVVAERYRSIADRDFA